MHSAVLVNPSPLDAALGRYASFFLLQDLVSRDFRKVRFFLPFTDFDASPLPDTVTEYLEYYARATAFIDARNRRISTRCMSRTLLKSGEDVRDFEGERRYIPKYYLTLKW